MQIARMQLLDQLGQACEGELPTPLVEAAYQKKMNQFQLQLQMMRTTLGQFLQNTRRTKEEFDKDLRERAESEVRISFALEQLAKAKELYPTQEELSAEMEVRAKHANKTVKEYMVLPAAKNLRQTMAMERARAYVLEHSIIVD